MPDLRYNSREKEKENVSVSRFPNFDKKKTEKRNRRGGIEYEEDVGGS